MSVARTWVFPILRIVVFAAIAAALVKLAFFPDATTPQNPEFPTGEIVEPQVPVMVGTIANDIVLDGTVNPDATAAAQATINGEVRQVSVSQGQWVDAGAELMQIRGQYDDGTNRWAIIKAPISGVLVEFDTLVGQTTSIGEVVARVAPSTFNVTAPIAPEDRYRLLDMPADAQVAIIGGPAPFTCTGLTIATASSGGDDDPGQDPGSTATDVVARCAVPSDVQVFPGLTATMTISGGIAENVLIVPTTAVEGGSGTGVVYVVAPDGSTEPREVTLGLSNGIEVEVLTGLEEGETVLQFVPGAPAGPGMGDPGMADCGDAPVMLGPNGEFLGCGG